jgi:hypothetical protein
MATAGRRLSSKARVHLTVEEMRNRKEDNRMGVVGGEIKEKNKKSFSIDVFNIYIYKQVQ